MAAPTKILAVVSEPRILAGIEPLLENTALELHQVANGEACLILAATARFDLILAQLPLVDMSMPRLLSAVLGSGSPSSEARFLFLAEGDQAFTAGGLRQAYHGRVVLTESRDEFMNQLAEMLDLPLRASRRVLVNLHLGVGDSRTTCVYETANISRSGMLLRTAHPLAVGTEFAFDICLPGGYPALQGLGSVVRHTKPARESVVGMGVRIDALEAEQTKCLERFVRSHLSPAT